MSEFKFEFENPVYQGNRQQGKSKYQEVFDYVDEAEFGIWIKIIPPEWARNALIQTSLYHHAVNHTDYKITSVSQYGVLYVKKIAK